MRRLEMMCVFELTPEEREDGSLDRVIEDDLKFLNGLFHPSTDYKWECVKQTPKHRMAFDAGYNRYYAKAYYERTA